ncbi:MAG: hypothetical protein ACTSP6_06815 [Promethearchaeota archaeon]
MKLISTKEAIQYINEHTSEAKEELAVLIYQYNKQSCAGSYLDFVVELDSIRSIKDQGIYENWKNINNSSNLNVEIYIEKRLIEDWKKKEDITLDIETTYKFRFITIK